MYKPEFVISMRIQNQLSHGQSVLFPSAFDLGPLTANLYEDQIHSCFTSFYPKVVGHSLSNVDYQQGKKKLN